MSLRTLLSLGLCCTALGAHAAGQVYVYNWTDYIGPTTNADFTQSTGIEVVYDVFDSNEVLESKLLSGRSGYDVVSPSHDFFQPQIRAGVYAKLDKSLLPNWHELNPKMMQMLAEEIDPDNLYGIPYTWGTTGIGYNPAKIAEVLGADAPVDSWALVLEPANMEKLAQCGVAFIDAPTEVLPAVLAYQGKDPYTTDSADYEAAFAQLAKVRPYIRYFQSAKVISDLANGEICAAVGWSGDMLQATDRAEEAGNGIEVAYQIPREGAGVWFDMLAIPADAPHKDAAHAYLNFILDPANNAKIVDYIGYASAVDGAKTLIDPELAQDPGVYPDAETFERLYFFKELPRKLKRQVNRQWASFKSGH